jgi:hypothetical protein
MPIDAIGDECAPWHCDGCALLLDGVNERALIKEFDKTIGFFYQIFDNSEQL